MGMLLSDLGSVGNCMDLVYLAPSRQYDRTPRSKHTVVLPLEPLNQMLRRKLNICEHLLLILSLT